MVRDVAGYIALTGANGTTPADIARDVLLPYTTVMGAIGQLINAGTILSKPDQRYVTKENDRVHKSDDIDRSQAIVWKVDLSSYHSDEAFQGWWSNTLQQLKGHLAAIGQQAPHIPFMIEIKLPGAPKHWLTWSTRYLATWELLCTQPPPIGEWLMKTIEFDKRSTVPDTFWNDGIPF